MSLRPTSDHPTAAADTPSRASPGPSSGAGPVASDATGPRPLILVGGLVALVVSLLIFGVIADDVREQEANALDGLLSPSLHALANPNLDTVMNGLTTAGSTLVVLPLLIVALALLVWRHHRAEALFLLVAMVGSVVLNESLKLLFHRPRPQLLWAQVQPEYSFPSGHAMNSLVFYGALALIAGVLWGRRVGVVAMALAILLAIAIGTSRIYLGYHYFTDVVGGLFAGAGWLLIMVLALGGARMRRAHAAEAAP